MSQHLKSITVTIDGDPAPRVFRGRDAWALNNLIAAGEKGCTPIDHPGPRWSHYVFKLRGGGIGIETIDEKHGGPYAGSHARYVLRTPVTVINRMAP
ncbi:hypothetical protein DWF00_16695 [Bosea caraganae]|uniref:Winged helix domain-containing protein n=1 Tax=Bosea caraganae TaxID=2763117 RepID=A0A370KYV0_9HYPH|nr:hypothetical protein [Bosea caraganae]RDJ20147.1 hypothetical protein DWE98_26295 [Bosea caraganae]RDJ24859.1 hypothetical protein DWF00_16695 [Bosea caraganae]